MNKLKILFFITLIIIGVRGWNVKAATNITPKNGIWNASGIEWSGGNNWTDGAFMASNKNYGTQGTLADDLTEVGRIRFYSYYNSGVMTSANSYTFKYKVCSDVSSGYYIYNGKSANSSSMINGNFNDFKKGVEVYGYFYNTSSEAITGAANGDPRKIVAEVQTVSGENNCIYQIFSITPESTYRAVGFQVRYNSDYGNLTSAMGKYTISLVSLTQQEGVAGIVRTGFEKTHEDLEKVDESIKGLPAKIWATIKADLQGLFVPTDEQMESLMDEVEETMTSKLGLLGLPATLYFNVMHILEDVESDSNWCFTWDAVKVPNFESYNIIQAGTWCFDSINENQKIASMRTTSHLLMGALILLGFVGYLWNKKNIILEIPDREDYVYITEEDSFMYDINSGEVVGNGMHKTKKTERRMKK